MSLKGARYTSTQPVLEVICSSKHLLASTDALLLAGSPGNASSMPQARAIGSRATFASQSLTPYEGSVSAPSPLPLAAVSMFSPEMN